MPIATGFLVENGTPSDLRSLLLRLGEMEKKLARFDAMEKELAGLKAENTRLKAELARKDKIIAGLQQRLFGSSSEKLDPAQLQLDMEELLLGKPAPPPDASGETSAPEEEKSKPAKPRRTKADRFPKNLKILVEAVIIPEEVLASPGTLLAPALAAQIIADKYQDHLPHYRQSQRFRRRHHIAIGRQTLNSWTHATASHLGSIDKAIRAELLQATALEIDEPPIDYQSPGHGSVREGRLWAYRDPVAGTCCFDWHAGRGADCLLAMLGYDKATHTIAFQGTIHIDGYTVHDAVAAKHGLRHGGCLAHIRRKFTDLGKTSPEVTLPVLRFIQHLYQIEKQTRQTAAPPACRELIRRCRSRPIADELHRFILGHLKTHLPAGNVGQALGYTLNQWPKFLHCLEQGVLEIDTNLVENMIRPTKLGMKNRMFFGSLEAGTGNAVIYTLLANCRAQDMDPEDYLVEVIKRLPHDATPEQAAALTPARIAEERRSAAEQAA